MLSVLVEGFLITVPVRRTSSKGSAFVTAQVRCPAEGGESVFCSVIAFQKGAVEVLGALRAGDAVAVTGPGSLSQWEKDGEPHVGLKVTATRVLGVQEAVLRRRAASAEVEPRSRPPAPAAPPGRSRPAWREGGRTAPTPFDDWDDDEPV